MINVFIKTESHFTVDRKKIRETVSNFLKGRGVKGDVEVSISIVGDRLMKKMNKKYRELDETTSVLAFPLSFGKEVAFIDPPDGVLHLGDILISYPQARELAVEEEELMDDKIDDLVIHGMGHLLGNN